MASFNKYTPVRMAVPFCAGILLALLLPFGFQWMYLFTALVILYILFLLLFRFLISSFSFRWLTGLVSQIILLLAGIAQVEIIEHKNLQKDASLDRMKDHALIICRIDERPVAKTRSFSCKATILTIADSLLDWKSLKSGILVYFRDDTLCRTLMPGDVIIAGAELQQLSGPANPGSFDFKRYMHYRQIRWQVFLDQGEWNHLHGAGSGGITRWAEVCRRNFHLTLEKYEIKGNDLALASGLILGSKEMLEGDIIREFSNAGAMHVLSVSGLHVGIMYVLADRVLFFMKRGKYGRKIQQVIIITLIWAYAFLTGLPPSVIRAGLMFSLIAAAGMIKRSHEGFNILAGACFIQLWINPFEIVQVGFQLSYLAVLGIFAFYKQVNDLFAGSKTFIAWTWSVIAVSLSAQLATFPLASQYFHFFPVYFLVTNLVVVPLAGVVVYFALFILVTGSLDLTWTWLGLPLKWSLEFMQRSVEFIQSWPGSVLKPISFTTGQTILIYLVIIGLFILYVSENRKGIYLVLSSFIMLLLISGTKKLERADQSAVVIYQVAGNTAIDLFNGRRSVFICDSSMVAATDKISFNIEPYRIRQGIREVRAFVIGQDNEMNTADTWLNGPYIFFKGKRIVLIRNKDGMPAVTPQFTIDIAVISGKQGPGIDQILGAYDVKQFVIDGSVPGYRSQRLLEEAKKTGVPCHATGHSGGYFLNW